MMEKRLIINIAENVIEVYIISDEYIRKCYFGQQMNSPLLCKYLDDSEYFFIVLDHERDIFNEEDIDLKISLRTNGQWFWSGDLNWYTRNKNFLWPEKFLDSVDRGVCAKVDECFLYSLEEKYRSFFHFLLSEDQCEESQKFPYVEILM